MARTDRHDLDLRTELCRGCGFVFTNPRPTAEGLKELYTTWYRPLYGHEAVPTEEGIARRGLDLRAAHTLSVLERFAVGAASALLEVGCGSGSLLATVGRAHPRIRRVGVEADSAYRVFARRHAGCEVLAGLDQTVDGAFDFAVLVHALEHFSDPVQLLRDLRARLLPDGLLYVDVPDARRYSRLHDLHLAHLSHFTLETLLAAASRAGFAPLLLEAHDPPCNVPSIHGVFRPGDPNEAGLRVAAIEESQGRGASAGLDRPAPPAPQELFRWFARQEWEKPWLVLGKGPSFQRRDDQDISGHHLLGLNHVCRELPVDLAHAIDLDVVEALGPTLLQRAGALVMPWRPHVRFKPTELTLAQAAAGNPILGRLAEEGRLLWYNCSSAPEPRPGSPVVQVCWFSGEAGVRLLALAGVERIRTLGVDGGSSYAPQFADLPPLTNGHASFDAQTQAIAFTAETLDLDFSPLYPQDGLEAAPAELAPLLRDARVLTVNVEQGLEERLPAEARPRLVLLGEVADHPAAVRLVRALHRAVLPGGELLVCARRALGSCWSSAKSRARASRWWLSEGFETEAERVLADGRKLLVLRRRDAPSPAWSAPASEPRLSIVLVSHQQCEQVMDLVGAIRALTHSPYELCVVDNASADDLRPFLRQLAGEPGVHLIENARNLGCAAASNQALRKCSREYVVYLCASHALVLSEGWEDELLGFMERHPEVGIAGDAWTPPYLAESDRFAPGWDPARLSPAERLHVQGGAWVARRSLFDRVGLFHEERYPQGGMDVELSFRLLSLGEQLARHPAVSCPPWPERPSARPGLVVIHPAGEPERRTLRARLWGTR